MRRSFTKLSNPIGNATKQTLLSSSSAFPYSTSSGDGGGRGRGRGRGSDFFNSKFSPTSPGNSDSPSPPSTLGHGHGRGQPPRSNPSFSFVAPADPRGRGGGPISFTQPGPPPSESILTPSDSISKKPIFLRNEKPVDSVPNPPNLALPSNNSILSEGGPAQGRGRGKPVPLATEKPKEKNRHIRTRPPPELGKEKAIGERESNTRPESNTGPKLSKEEAINRARNVLSRDGDGGGGRRGSNADEGGRGGRGRGRRVGRGRGRGAMDYSDEDEYEDDEEEDPEFLAEEEAFQEGIVKTFGVEKAKLVLETYEVATDDALPSVAKEAYLEAMDANFMIECEPEYMVEIENPDIDEKPPIPLRDALEKMKPFLMAYEDIRTDEEWEEVVEDAMASVPLMEKIVDEYGGPDIVTAKQQEEELERVAKTLPESAPSSVKQFTDRVVLSLQSNPGWGFDKKYQFMDKLVREVSQSYK